MPRYYQIVRLVEGRSIFPDPERLTVDLDATRETDLVENDVAFGAAIAPKTWFWLSGGGTLLLNGRFLVIVQRSAGARVNPGKLSLFTGRADNAAERAAPAALVRELFEELLLFEDGMLLTPQLDYYQPLIDRAHAQMRQAGILGDDVAHRPLRLTSMALPDRAVRIRYQNADQEHRLTWVAGPANDINVLFLFGALCDLDRLSARDGEFHRTGDGQVVPGGRELFLYDMARDMVRSLTGPGDGWVVRSAEMTGPLQCLIGHCRGLLPPPA